MIREQKAPSGLRPSTVFTVPDLDENYDTVSSASSRIASSNKGPSTLTASSRNNHSIINFGEGQSNGKRYIEHPPFEFLPSLNFDDLQTSLNPTINYPDGYDSMARPNTDDTVNKPGHDVKATVAARSTASTRPLRTGSLARRQSTSTRKGSMSSVASTNSGTNELGTTGTSMRAPRQPKYPPISGSGAMKGSRKSVGPGVLDTEFSSRRNRSRTNLTNSTSLQGLSEGNLAGRSSIGSTTSTAEVGARLASARASKTKSLQPPSRNQLHLNPPVTPTDHNRSSSFTGRSPGRSNGRGTATPSSSARRMSVMPGMPPSASHATGLGARTISPTDARRAKRLSMVPPMPQTPPVQSDQSMPRAASKSPSAIPMKTSTPSSLRTTPDQNRKSYSSGLSSASATSFNTARTSTGSLQPRMPALPGLPPSASTSRLPTPKPNSRTVHSSAGNDDEDEEVPPVPAIPKAYGSPKDSPAEQPFFEKQPKSSLPLETGSFNSNSTSDLLMPPPPEPSKSDASTRSKNVTTQEPHDEVHSSSKKNLQSLRLPPLTLLPLSTPTAAKVAALKPESASESGIVTPPPRRPNKTPSTPMTASKASFFSSSKTRAQEQAEDLPLQPRAISSINHTRVASNTIRHVSGSHAVPIPVQPSKSARATVSPFVSSSLPQGGSSEMTLARSNTTSNIVSTDANNERNGTKLTGPRAQKLSKESNRTSTRSSPEEPATPSSTSSLRRKLSMGWRRTTSKSSISLSHAANERDAEYPQPSKHNDMPPPKLPATATFNNFTTATSVPSPSPSLKTPSNQESKRRKSSISSLNVFGNHSRTTSEIVSTNGASKADGLASSPKLAPRSSSNVLSAAHKMLNNKSSGSTLRSQNSWQLDLDKDDLVAEDEMRRLASRRKETETAAKQLDALRRRAVPKERVSPQQAVQIANLNLYEKGEIIDYKDVYFCGTHTAQKHVGDLSADGANFGYDDDRGDYSIVIGDHLSYRYEIVDVLGKGSFGQVVRCVDHKTGGLVAVKIIRNKKRFHQQALVEVNILKKLREWDPHNKHSMVSFTQSFYFRGHLCISTELLDMNLYEFIKSNSFRGFSLKLIRRFTKQLLSSLLLLKQHKVIHCDLKPENILLAHPLHSEIKVIDFGSSCFENEKVYTYIQSRFYRSPEVILGMAYGMPIDMWSVGCILAELFTGYPIFPGENEQEQLACIMEVFGPPEKHLIEKSTRKKLFFDSLGKPRLTVSSKGRRRKPSSKTLQQVLKCEDEAFIDFLAKCLRWDPDRRLKPDEAVRHEFLTGMKSSMPRASTAARAGSPSKRSSTITASTTTASRPLPEPPTTSFKNSIAIRNNPAQSSPVKVSGVQRRQSTATTFNSSTGSNTSGVSSTVGAGKRISLGGANLGSSTTSATGLPRIAQRNLSSGTFANAGATAAMRRG